MPASRGAPRSLRVAEAIRAELEGLFLRGSVRDPAAAGATITEVEVTRDLALAHVRVRLLAAEVSEAKKTALVAALVRARGHLRKELASRLGMRHTPSLMFHWDDGRDRAHRVAELLAEIHHEGKSR